MTAKPSVALSASAQTAMSGCLLIRWANCSRNIGWSSTSTTWARVSRGMLPPFFSLQRDAAGYDGASSPRLVDAQLAADQTSAVIHQAQSHSISSGYRFRDPCPVVRDSQNRPASVLDE